MNKKISFFFSFLFLVLILSFSVPDGVYAYNYYNVIDNPSFCQELNIIEDGGFESGLWLQGEDYGDWNISGTGVSIIGSVEHSGSYCAYMTYTGGYVYYNLTYYDGSPILGADVGTIGGWFMASYGGFNIGFQVLYSDASSDSGAVCLLTDDEVWYEINNFTDIIDPAKYVVQIRFAEWSPTYFNGGTGANNLHMDDMYWYHDDGSDVQDSVDYDSEPYYWGADYPNSILAPEMVSTKGRLDDYSMMMYVAYVDYNFNQRIDYFDSDNLHFIDLYYYANSGEGSYGIKITVTYSDGSYDERTIVLDTYDAWTYLNFGASWVSDGKLITRIRWSVSGTYKNVWIDDVGMWSSVALDYSAFVYTLSPSPKETVSKQQVVCYGETTYTMYGYVYNATDTLAGNGTVTITDSFGSHSGSVVDGEFTYTMAKRSVGTTEYMGILIVLDDDTVLEFVITFSWEGSGGASIGDSDFGDAFTDYLMPFLVIFFPAVVMSVGVGSMGGSPFQGFIVGLVFGVSGGIMAGLIPAWFLFLIAIAFIYLFLTMRHSGR